LFSWKYKLVIWLSFLRVYLFREFRKARFIWKYLINELSMKKIKLKKLSGKYPLKILNFKPVNPLSQKQVN